MSKLFGPKPTEATNEENQLPLVSELQPEIDAEVSRLQALSLQQLAAEILTKAFGTEYKPDAGTLEIGGVVDAFLPPHGEWEGAVWKEPDPPRSLYVLRDLIREGVQVLEHRGLLMPKGYSTNGNWYHAGYVTTRVARAALADGSVERILAPTATHA